MIHNEQIVISCCWLCRLPQQHRCVKKDFTLRLVLITRRKPAECVVTVIKLHRNSSRLTPSGRPLRAAGSCQSHNRALWVVVSSFRGVRYDSLFEARRSLTLSIFSQMLRCSFGLCDDSMKHQQFSALWRHELYFYHLIKDICSVSLYKVGWEILITDKVA